MTTFFKHQPVLLGSVNPIQIFCFKDVVRTCSGVRVSCFSGNDTDSVD